MTDPRDTLDADINRIDEALKAHTKPGRAYSRGDHAQVNELLDTRSRLLALAEGLAGDTPVTDAAEDAS